jgi:hypothetical protein
MLVTPERSARVPRSIRRLALDAMLFYAVLIALPFLMLARLVLRRRP